MHPHDFAFAEGNDLEIFFLAAGFANYVLDGESRAGWRVFLVRVVALEDLSGVVVTQGGGRGPGDIEEQVHTYGKIGRVDESSVVRIHQFANAVPYVVPTGCAHDHVFSRVDAGFDVGDYAVWGGEVDDYVDVAQLFGGERGAFGVLSGTGNSEVVFAFAGYFGDQRAGFSTP